VDAGLILGYARLLYNAGLRVPSKSDHPAAILVKISLQLLASKTVVLLLCICASLAWIMQRNSICRAVQCIHFHSYSCNAKHCNFTYKASMTITKLFWYHLKKKKRSHFISRWCSYIGLTRINTELYTLKTAGSNLGQIWTNPNVGLKMSFKHLTNGWVCPYSIWPLDGLKQPSIF